MGTRRFARVVLVLGIAGFGGLGPVGRGSARASERWAEAMFDALAHDFGPVPRGAIVRHHFVLTNRLDEPITLLDLRASCGCTTGRASASQVAPGQAAVVEAQMDTRNFVGRKSTVLTVSLVTAGGRQAEVRLGVKSDILSDIVLNPGTIDFGVVSRGQAAQQVLTIDRTGAPGWKVERMLATKALSRVVDAQIVETSRTDQAVGYRLTVALRPDAPAGVVREEIRIATNDPEAPVVPVLVSAEVRGALSASPSFLALGRATSSDGVQGRFLVRGIKPFAITKVEGQGDGFEVAAAEPSARKAIQVLTVTFRPEPGAAPGELSRTFRVHTDLPGEPALELKATARVEP